MSMCMKHHDFGGEILAEQCPDCVIEKLNKSLAEHRRIIERIKSARNMKDWEELNMCVRELCDLKLEPFK